MNLSDLVDFNPPADLKRGVAAPFIDMSSLPTSNRFVSSASKRPFSGSGSRFRDGDTLFARITPCLENRKGGFVRGLGNNVVGHGSTEFIVLRAKDPRDADFVYYLSKYNDFRAFATQRMSGTSGRQRVSWQSLADYQLLDFDATQRAVVSSLLTALDEKISVNEQINHLLEAVARAVFQDWFVNFGPVRARKEHRSSYWSNEVWSLFPAELDEEGRPEGWGGSPLSDVIEFNPQEYLKRGSLAPYLEMAALPTAGPVSDEPSLRPFTSGSRFRNGDALFARITPCLENGKTAFVQNLDDDAIGWGSTEFIVMRARQPAPPCLAYLIARDDAFRAHAIQSMTGTSGRQRARTEILKRYTLVSPPSAVWFAFASFTQPLFEMLGRNGAESAKLAETRDLLLPRLMSGEIRVRDAEQAVEAAL